MKEVLAIIISVYSFNTDKEAYVLEYTNNKVVYKDTLILPKQTFKQQDTIAYRPYVAIHQMK